MREYISLTPESLQNFAAEALRCTMIVSPMVTITRSIWNRVPFFSAPPSGMHCRMAASRSANSALSSICSTFTQPDWLGSWP